MKGKRIFLSGKVSGLDYNTAKRLFEIEEYKLTTLEGCKVINPTKLCKPSWSWTRCMLVCIRYLTICDGIYMLHNWKESRGAKVEHFIAKYIFCMQVIYQ
jgi:hypothetical protein